MPRHEFDEKKKHQVEKMTELGVPDVEICKKTELSAGYVSRITTEYWKNKMNNK